MQRTAWFESNFRDEHDVALIDEAVDELEESVKLKVIVPVVPPPTVVMSGGGETDGVWSLAIFATLVIVVPAGRPPFTVARNVSIVVAPAAIGPIFQVRAGAPESSAPVPVIDPPT